MAQEITQTTDVESKIKEQAKKETLYGFVSNKFGKVTIINRPAYENMLRNNDTMLDDNGLNDTFANLTEKEHEVISNYNKAEIGAKKDKLKTEAHKIIVKKVSMLRNWMQKFLEEKIADDKTDLEEEVLEELKKVKLTSGIDNSQELAEKDAEIEKLKKQLEKAQSKKGADETPKTPVVTDQGKAEEPQNSTDNVPEGSTGKVEEDDPFKK